MKPKPFVALNHFTVPVATSRLPLNEMSVSTAHGFFAIKKAPVSRAARHEARRPGQRDRSPAPYSGARLSVEVSFPQQHLNMRRVRPSLGQVMLSMSSAFARQCRQRTTSASNDFEL